MMRVVKVVVKGQEELLEGVYWGPEDTVVVRPPSPERPYWEIRIWRSDGRKEVIVAGGGVMAVWEGSGEGEEEYPVGLE